MNTIKLRQDFISYFRENKHKFLKPSGVYLDDPTLYFVNAGMNQLKNIFLGTEGINENFTRLMNSQIYIRAGGKHNDFDVVGKDSYHLTSFEMLGNWSLNDYGKEEAIRLAYNYLINNCKLNKDQIYVTYFEGTNEIPEDTETKEIWKQYVNENKIIKGNFKDNFWTMGDTGPCGVCTEIHYDLLGNRDASNLVNKDDPQVIEIWNIVCISYNRTNDSFQKLDKSFIDTGMGLERLAMIMQNRKSIYQIDIFRCLISYCQALTNNENYVDEYSDNLINISYRIFADHIRTCIISLHQNVDFDCCKRGFILRKIFRRLLNNIYINLIRKIKPIMHHPIFQSIIFDVLNYYLEFKHDPIVIQQKMVNEEKLYLGILESAKTKYDKQIKKTNDSKLAIEKLKNTYGIDEQILNFIN